MSTNKIRYKRNKRKPRVTLQEPVDKQWSKTKIHKELSSFIAQFSYLEDTPGSNHSILHQGPSRSYQVLPVQYQQHTFNVDKVEKKHKKKSRPRKQRNDSVIWRDINVEEPSYNVRCYDTRSHETIPCKMEVHRSRSKSRERKASRRPYKKRDKEPVNRGRSLIKNKQFRRAQSEDRKCCKPFKINKSRQSFSVKPNWQARRTRSRSRSCSKLKEWPLRYEKRSVRSIHVQVGRQDYQIDYKLPNEMPPVVKLFPRNTDYINILDCDASRHIMTHNDLPCKCTKCVTKFELVRKMPQKKKHRYNTKLKEHGSVPANACVPQGIKCPQVPPCLQMTRPCQPCYPRFPCWPPPYRRGFSPCFQARDPPCISPFTVCPDSTECEDCCLDQRMNSFSIQCNTYGQQINSSITQYFHSILNRQFSCS